MSTVFPAGVKDVNVALPIFLCDCIPNELGKIVFAIRLYLKVNEIL